MSTTVRRRRPLRGIRVLLTLMITGNVLVLINALLAVWDRQFFGHFPVPVEDVYGPQPYVLQQANLHLHPWSVQVSVSDPTLLQAVLAPLANGLPVAVAALGMAIFARRLVDRAAGLHPFTVEMAHGLRRLGAVILVGGVLAEVVRAAAALALYRTALPHGHPFTGVDWLVHLWWLLPGLMVLGFAQVIAYGCTLRAELDEVI
ncbi:hypothetical protein [Krasilnikovia sp. MM14-A1259]|uniref:hypothetical protein n=1 Tax=Krasilnikovia sp. MM14-A1259 TaxID=3373539 RepID=UPI0038147668